TSAAPARGALNPPPSPRRRQGLRYVRIALHVTDIDALIRMRLLKEDERQDVEALQTALPNGVHRIRHYGLFANGNRAANIARARELLNAPPPQTQSDDAEASKPDEP